MKKRNLRTRAALIILSASIVSTGCAIKNEKTEAGPVTLRLTYWGSQQREDLTNKAIQLFEQKHPNIKVQAERVPNFAGITTNYAMATADQNLPDIMQMEYAFITAYMDRKLLEPLDPYVKQGALNLEDVDDSLLASGKKNNILYGVTVGVNSPILGYDPALFAKAGVEVPKDGYTFDDLYKTAKDLKSKIKENDFYPIEELPDFGYYLRTKGATYYNEAGTALGYDNDQYFVDYVLLLNKLQAEGLLVPDSVLEKVTNDKDLPFVRGKAAIYHLSTNQVSGISKTAGRPVKIMPYPATAGGQEGKYIKPSMFLTISAFSKNKPAAAEFINFFVNDPEANDILVGERGVPVSSKITQRLMGTLGEADKEPYVYMDSLKAHSKPIDPPAPKVSGKITALFKLIANRSASGEITVEEAAKQFRVEANRILSGETGGSK